MIESRRPVVSRGQPRKESLENTSIHRGVSRSPLSADLPAGRFVGAARSTVRAPRPDSYTGDAMRSDSLHATVWLARYARLVVAATFGLLFVGGLVTSHQAGMAVPDWPLSFGTLNPDHWWTTLPVRLEHGHRLYAATVGLLTTVLCAWIWRNGWSLFWAVAVATMLSFAATGFGVSRLFITHIGIWSFAAAFAVALLYQARHRSSGNSMARWLAFAAFIGIALQATFGGLRVTLENSGNLEAALVLRIAHGCVAQIELCVLVAIAAVVSPVILLGAREGRALISRRLQIFAWVVVGAIFVQLVLGAAMRHLGAGLAIPTFPAAAPDGSWLPAVHNIYSDLNFAHTRLGSVLVAGLIVALAARVIWKAQREICLTRPAWLIIALVVIQFMAGVFVIWHGKPATLTTFHVVNGAAVFAGTVLLAIRASILKVQPSPETRSLAAEPLTEAAL